MSAPSETNPNAFARAKDTLVDVKRAASEFRSAVESDGVKKATCRSLRLDAWLSRIENFTKRNPLTAVSIALGVGLWINRRR